MATVLYCLLGTVNLIMNTLIYLTLLAIAKQKGIDENDTIEVILYSIENGLNPVEEFRKAFYCA
jgi:hypothetical protein